MREAGFLLAGLCLTLASRDAFAMCARKSECVRLSGEIASCEVVREGSEDYLRFHVPKVRVDVSACRNEKNPELRFEGRDMTWLAAQDRFVTRQTRETTCQTVGSQLSAIESELCCDVLPHTGACAVSGVHVELRSPGN